MYQEVFDLLTSRLEEPLVLVDIGARWGAVNSWLQFGDKAKIYCFEADKDEADRLNHENVNSNIEYVPLALFSKIGEIILNITEGVGCSSIYEPMPVLYERYPALGIIRPARRIICPTTTLDTFLVERQITAVHALKLDTQGSELNILIGAEQALKHCELIVVEVEFNALYKTQPLFCDVDRFLRDRGFCLWRLNNLAHYSTGILQAPPHHVLCSVDPGGYQYVPLENGQLFWGDAIYVKERGTAISTDALDLPAAVAAASLVSQHGLWDLAIELVRKAGDETLLQQLIELIPPGQPLGTLSYQIDYLTKELANANAEIARLHFENAKERAMKPLGALRWIGRMFRNLA